MEYSPVGSMKIQTSDGFVNLASSAPSMAVALMDYTGKGTGDPWYAASLMIWTKRTRVEMSPGGLEEILSWPKERKVEELEYMAATVPSSWEFCDYTFLLQNVTRAFTHQLVRTRTASYAQQAMQVLDMSQGPGWNYLVGPSLRGKIAEEDFRWAMEKVALFYKTWVNRPGIKTEDVRGALPTNILTNIVVKANLRTLCDMIRKRTSPRNQGEFVDVLNLVKYRMVQAHPWASIFLDRMADRVAAEAYALLEGVPDPQLRTAITKRIDQLLTNVGAGDQ